MRMRLRSTSAHLAIALLAAALTLAGCSHSGRDPASSGNQDGPTSARRALAALHAGLSRRAVKGTSYYLSLGDSLSQGVQPTPTGPDVATSHGYPDRLAATLRRKLPRLRPGKV